MAPKAFFYYKKEFFLSISPLLLSYEAIDLMDDLTGAVPPSLLPKSSISRIYRYRDVIVHSQLLPMFLKLIIRERKRSEKYNKKTSNFILQIKFMKYNHL